MSSRISLSVTSGRVARGARAGDRVLLGQRFDLGAQAALDQVVEVVAVEVVRRHAHQEAIEHRASASSFGTSFDAPYSEISGTRMLALPLKNRRSLRMLSSEFRIAEFDLKISSRNTISASGSMSSMRRVYVPSRNAVMSTGPNSSFGSVNRVSRYSK